MTSELSEALSSLEFSLSSGRDASSGYMNLGLSLSTEAFLGLTAARSTILFSLPKSLLLRTDFLRRVPDLPNDLRVVPVLISFKRLSMIQPSSDVGGIFLPPVLPSPFFILASSAFFLAASLLSRFSSRITLCLFS